MRCGQPTEGGRGGPGRDSRLLQRTQLTAAIAGEQIGHLSTLTQQPLQALQDLAVTDDNLALELDAFHDKLIRTAHSRLAQIRQQLNGATIEAHEALSAEAAAAKGDHGISKVAADSEKTQATLHSRAISDHSTRGQQRSIAATQSAAAKP